jgi:hypothetical protein
MSNNQTCLIKLLHKCFHFLWSLLMLYWTSLCVLRRTCRQSSLYETLFQCNILRRYSYTSETMSIIILPYLLHPYHTLITPLLYPYYTLITPLLHPYYTLITPLLYPYYTLITPFIILLLHRHYTVITPLLHPYYTLISPLL